MSDSESESEIVGMICFDGESVLRICNGKNLRGAFGDDWTELEGESGSE